MSEQTLKRILVGLGLLVAAYAVVALLRGSPGTEAGGGEALARALSGIDSATVREVAFQRADDTVTLLRGEKGWTVDGHDADSARVASLFQAMSADNAGGVIARNPANHPRLGVTADSATRVVFRREGNDSAVVLVGSSASSPSSSYVRLAGDDAVYVLEGGLRTAARRPVPDWRDKGVARVDTAAAAVVEVTRDGAGYTLERGEDGWTVDGATADEATARSLLSGLTRLTASGFAPDSVRVTDPERRIVVRDADDRVLADLLIAPGTEDSSMRVQRAEGGPVYRVSTYRVDRLTPEPATLRGQEGPEAPGGE